MPKNYCIMQIWAESGKSALPICNYSQILYQFLTFTQNLKRSPFFLSITYLPFLCQQKIADVAVLDPVSVPVELIQRDNIFRVVIADIVIRTELTLNGLIGCQQIGNLNIQFFSTLVTYKVDRLVSGSADCHFVVPAQQLQIHDVL